MIKEGVGRDNVSDFATNLIKKLLLNYTQEFTLNNLSKEQRREWSVSRSRFDYNLEVWVSEKYTLPAYRNDYVILTPRNILTKDENWINQKDLIDRFDDIPSSVPNPQLRAQVANYFYNRLEREREVDKEPTNKDRRTAALDTLGAFPWLIDYYIKIKEETGNEALSVAEEKLIFVQVIFQEAVRQISAMLPEQFYASPPVGTYEEAHQRLSYLRHVIEDQGGHRLFYMGDKPIQRESDLHVLYRLVWYGTRSDFGAEANDGRGPVDFKISYGAKDKTLVEFKLAKNSQLKANLKNQVGIYEKASDAQKGIKAIFYFSAEELQRVTGILDALDLRGHRDVVLIDARNDNKPSASKARG